MADDLPEYIRHDNRVWKRVYQHRRQTPEDIEAGRDFLYATYAWPWNGPSQDWAEWPQQTPLARNVVT
jgi:hypothetical protein